MAGNAACDLRRAHAVRLAAGETDGEIARLTRSSLRTSQYALDELNRAVAEWERWHAGDPFPAGDPVALRADIGGPVAPRVPRYEARFRLVAVTPAWQSLGLFDTAEAARTAFARRFGPWTGREVQLWIRRLDGVSDGVLVELL